ncbi:MAG: DNA polymerase III subunit delta' [Acidobacteria bacterium]|nr:DNA polymerase III subunit delta' [Acidobacteriota bacterium]
MKDFIGNKAVRLFLDHSLRRQALAHAFIFSGPEGIGKKKLALALAKAIHCRGGQEGLNSCGVCAPCRKIESGAHPDVQVITPETKAFKIDQIRHIIQDIYFQPFEGPMRVFILDDADRMTEEAANCLLKTLEEPPEKSVLVLITTNIYALLPTIQSRGQVLKFLPIPSREIEHYLRVRHDVAPEHALVAARLSQGSVGNALRMPIQTFEQYQKLAFSLFEHMVEGDDASVSTLAAQVTSRPDFDLFLHIFISVLRDLVIMECFREESQHLLHRGWLESLLKIRKGLTLEQVHDLLRESGEFYRKRHLNVRTDIFFLNLLLKHRGGLHKDRRP